MHYYDPNLTPDFVAKINDHTDEKLFNIRAFILVDNNFDSDVGFNNKVDEWTQVSRITTQQATFITQIISTSPFMVATISQDFEIACEGYRSLTYLLSVFIFL